MRPERAPRVMRAIAYDSLFLGASPAAAWRVTHRGWPSGWPSTAPTMASLGRTRQTAGPAWPAVAWR